MEASDTLGKMAARERESMEKRLASVDAKRRSFGRMALLLAAVFVVAQAVSFVSDLSSAGASLNALVTAVCLIFGTGCAILGSRAAQRKLALERSLDSIRSLEHEANGEPELAQFIQATTTHKNAGDTSILSHDLRVYGMLFLSLGACLIIYVVGSVPDFLDKYNGFHSGTVVAGSETVTEGWLESYENELLSYSLLGFFLFGWGISQFTSGNNLANEGQRLEVERELVQHGDISGKAVHARKLFLLNEQNLRRYYGANRANARWALLLALLCIGAGVAVTFGSFRLMTGGDLSGDAQVLVGVVGAASTIMVNVVAAIVIRLQGSIWSNVNSFHERLGLTHVVAAVIDCELRARFQ